MNHSTAKYQYRILLIEDEATSIALYHTALSGKNDVADYPVDQPYTLTVCKQASEGVEAVQKAKEEDHPFSLAFIDLYLPPGHDGIWAAEKIRTLDPRIEIVIVTSLSDLDEDELAWRVPPPHKLLYIEKPVSSREILQFTSSLCAKWRTETDVRNLYSKQDERISRRTKELTRINTELNREIEGHKETEENLEKTLNDLRSVLGGIVSVITSTVEARDPYTAGHQSRVSDLSRAIATELHLEKSQIDGIRIAGVVHDLGKISVPAEILSKPGKLSIKEFDLITDHPQTGYDLLKTISFSWPIAPIVYQHHERLDGSGYPQGLNDPDILLEAKIVGVADVVEAMASHRPYRPALGIEMALDEIKKHRGVLYSSDVVDACLNVFQNTNFQFHFGRLDS